MPSSHLSLVNQKLAYASSIIDLLSEPLADLHSAQRLERQALGDAAVFHLVMALHFYLRELAEHHYLKNLSAIHSVEDLLAALLQVEKVSSESSELLLLTQTAGTWLNQLLGYYDQLSKSPEKRKEKKSFGQDNLIELVELSGDVEGQSALKLTSELLLLWLNSFRLLIARQRETSAEY